MFLNDGWFFQGMPTGNVNLERKNVR